MKLSSTPPLSFSAIPRSPCQEMCACVSTTAALCRCADYWWVPINSSSVLLPPPRVFSNSSAQLCQIHSSSMAWVKRIKSSFVLESFHWENKIQNTVLIVSLPHWDVAHIRSSSNWLASRNLRQQEQQKTGRFVYSPVL